MIKGIRMVDPTIMAKVKEYLQTLSHSGLSVAFGVVFGSQATSHERRIMVGILRRRSGRALC